MRTIYGPSDIEPQLVITKTNAEIVADSVMWACPTVDEEGIKRTFRNIDDWKRAAIQLGMMNLCQEFGELSLNKSLVARETIATNLQWILNTFIIELGLTVSLPVDTSSDGNGHEKYGKG